MATSTYNPNDTNCAAQEGGDGAAPPGSLGGWIDEAFSSVQEDTVSTDDGNNVNDLESGSGGQVHRFDFTIVEAEGDVSQIDFLWKGYANKGAPPPDLHWGSRMYIWDDNGSTWVHLTTGAASSKETLNGQRTTNIANYINGSSVIYFCITADADTPTTMSNVWSYYAECVITYSPAVPVDIFFGVNL